MHGVLLAAVACVIIVRAKIGQDVEARERLSARVQAAAEHWLADATKRQRRAP